jgi:hypothetical protein
MNIFQKIWVKTTLFFSRIHWKSDNLLSDDELSKIKEALKPNYYVILTRRNNHFTTYMISVANFFLTGKFSYWSHALMNLEDEVEKISDFRLVEAIGTGVTISPFKSVFNVNGVVLLKPKHLTIEKWTAILDKAKGSVGRPYDSLFDLKNDSAMSCVELVRYALQADPDYTTNFAEFEAMISKRKNLTPQMFYDCADFEVVYEVRRR